MPVKCYFGRAECPLTLTLLSKCRQRLDLLDLLAPVLLVEGLDNILEEVLMIVVTGARRDAVVILRTNKTVMV